MRCRVEHPAGSQWIWVAWRAEGEPGLSISICTPTGDLATPEGQALLAEAEATFGDIGIILPGSGGSGSAPPETTGDNPAAAGDETVVVAAAVLVLGAGVVVLGGVALLARRRHVA